MPTLETTEGTVVDAAAAAEAIKRQFDATMNDPGPDDQALPKRTPKAAESEAPKPKRGRPPKSEQARTTDKAATEVVPPTPAVTAKRASSAEDTFRLAGTCLLMAGKITRIQGFTADGFIVNANAGPLAAALADVAAVEPQIAKWLDKAPSAKVSAWMGLATVAGGLALQAAANHRLIKPGVMGTSDPADIIRVNEEAIAAQQKAIEDEQAEMARLAEDAENEPAAA